MDEKGLKLKYKNITGNFVQATFLDATKIKGATLYLKKNG
ncbi:hypothetical protein L950_0230790 [Sphingobacterium sp. IITKGP-BTPF85]|nr:hypothetical protein L950_0230790 [Sphingobacterium sp. IITKGP-BTPF85]